MGLVFVDVEAGPAIGIGRLKEFGAVYFATRQVFHGKDDSKETFIAFDKWLADTVKGRPIFVSDNVAFDWQWINYHFWQYLGRNPFGFSGRRIGDFYAGLVGNFHETQKWKKLRITRHDHHPVHDALGNVEAFQRLLNGER